MKISSVRPPLKRALWLGVAACAIASCRASSAQTTPFPPSKWNRVLIVSGGPDVKNNQYAIESNARYVASLTRNARWRRILFADGQPTSKTISTVVDNQSTRARAVASWIWDLNAPDDATLLKAPTLSPISGASTPDSINQNLAALGATTDATGAQLVYVTGHGSPGTTLTGAEDYVNTLYSAWSDDYSVRQIARVLQASKSTAPLLLVMVQCHGGGFANVLFQDGDPTKPIWDRDFCGFFASIPERMAAGCTSQVNERDYQDFTTHFFAALSGVSRDGRRVSGADYDRNGRIAFDEAYAYAQINDDSIDVPLSTSDAFLRHALGREKDTAWQKTSFSRLSKDATPAQLALLNQLSAKLGLSGENRLAAAQKRYDSILSKARNDNRAEETEWDTPQGVDNNKFIASYARLEQLLNRRFPKFAQLTGSARTRALNEAATLLEARPADLSVVYRAYSKSVSKEDTHEVEEARILRFLRVGRSIILTKRLEANGDPQQKAVFARLRTSETRSAF